jgi:predicted alpha/beta-fold hydrolase
MAAANATFVPARGLGHPLAQTVFAAIARRWPAAVLVERERWEMADGDFIDVDLAAPAGPPRGFLVLVHGLEGSSRAGYMTGLLALAQARGLAVAAMNFRSCSGEENRLARSYHSGASDDLRFVVGRAIARHAGLPGAVAGFSLGANVTLKWLAEEGRGAPDAIRGVAAVSCPFDLALCAAHLDTPACWWLRAVFLRTLRAKALAKAARFPGALDAAAVRRARTFREFDDLVTAPLHGFRDAADYWRRASSGPLLGEIARPALLLSAIDDPLIPPACLPGEAARANPALAFEVTAQGGHVGFVAGSALAPRYWAEERVLSFVDDLFARP